MATLITRDFLPVTLDERSVFLTNFVSVLASGTNATDLGVSAAQLERLQNGQKWYGYLLSDYLPYARSYSEGMTAFLTELDTDKTPQTLALPVWAPPVFNGSLPDTASGVMNDLVALVNDPILKSSKLTPALKTQLRLDPLPLSPAGEPKIKSYKAGPNGAIDLLISVDGAKQTIVDSMRGEETEFSPLDKVVGSHVYDNRPNLVAGRPEARQYRTRHSDGTAAYGNYSAVFSVTTQA